jgi:oxygen-independent coproporphyrinogen-3 oxidase
MPLGLYISVPFCRAKCSFCNFASGVFSLQLLERYVAYLVGELGRAEQIASQAGGSFERSIDSVYLGGGTPTMLAAEQLTAIFSAIGGSFHVLPGAEITIECAPGTLTPELVEAFVRWGVNRVSLGVQSFIEQEARAVGRLHTREIVLREIDELRRAGISEISIDLIAGLPHQTEASWRRSLEETIASSVPHASVYMLEVDADSRLGRELLAGGTRYHAHFVPDDDRMADFYLLACDELNAAGITQYEISNFARDGAAVEQPSCAGLPAHASRHNLKYWLRQPYMGFGVDAHSMLLAVPTSARNQGGALDHRQAGADTAGGAKIQAVRFATSDELDKVLSGAELEITPIDARAAVEEMWFLGLRLNRGVELSRIEGACDEESLRRYREVVSGLEAEELLRMEYGFARLTPRGRLLSNEVFSRFLLGPQHAVATPGAPSPTA